MSIYRVALAKGHAAKTGVKVCIVCLYFQLVFQIDHVVSYFCRKILFVCPKIIIFIYSRVLFVFFLRLE